MKSHRSAKLPTQIACVHEPLIMTIKSFIVQAPVWLGFFLVLKQECALPKPFFLFVAINSTNEANKAARTRH